MKKIISKLMGGVLLFSFSMSLTSCEGALDDILGEWSRPTPGNVTPGTDEGGVTSITVDLSKIDAKYLDSEKTKLQLTVGDEVTLSFTILPEEMADTKVELTADDATILSIDGLKVTALKAGETKVTAKAGEKEAYLDVMVKELVNLSAITEDYTAQDGTVLTGTLDNKVKISIADNATVTLNNVSINADDVWKDGSSAGITCLGDATINLEGTNNKVKGFGASYPGIYVPVNKTLIIQGSGSLDASSGMDSDASEFGAGIGGGKQGTCGDITIKGGNITATGGYSGGAGIGSGYNQGTCGKITITGGTITAEGGYYAAGIGGGYAASCDAITISGGTVEATGGEGAAGIGSGKTFMEGVASCGNITINGGTITATGGKEAAGIGGGYKNGTCGTITITSGVTSVTATKGNSAPNSIGKGSEGTTISVTIGGVDGAITTSPYTYPAP